MKLSHVFLHIFLNVSRTLSMLIFNVYVKVILPPRSVTAQSTFKRFVASVDVHVVSQSLAVSVLVTTKLTLVSLRL